MSTSRVFIAIAAAVALTTGPGCSQSNMENKMEKCKIVKDGRGLIKENRADCASANNSCAGHNKAGDPEAWIIVPEGQCAKINNGDFSGVDQTTQDKIEDVF